MLLNPFPAHTNINTNEEIVEELIREYHADQRSQQQIRAVIARYLRMRDLPVQPIRQNFAGLPQVAPVGAQPLVEFLPEDDDVFPPGVGEPPLNAASPNAAGPAGAAPRRPAAAGGARIGAPAGVAHAGAAAAGVGGDPELDEDAGVFNAFAAEPEGDIRFFDVFAAAAGVAGPAAGVPRDAGHRAPAVAGHIDVGRARPEGHERHQHEDGAERHDARQNFVQEVWRAVEGEDFEALDDLAMLDVLPAVGGYLAVLDLQNPLLLAAEGEATWSSLWVILALDSWTLSP